MLELWINRCKDVQRLLIVCHQKKAGITASATDQARFYFLEINVHSFGIYDDYILHLFLGI